MEAQKQQSEIDMCYNSHPYWLISVRELQHAEISLNYVLVLYVDDSFQNQ